MERTRSPLLDYGAMRMRERLVEVGVATVLEDDEAELSLVAAIQDLQLWLMEIPEDCRANAMLRLHCGEDAWARVTISYSRPPTPEELRGWAELEKTSALDRTKRERAEYERLKRKFEPSRPR